ncbi:MAG: hypothetical protein HOO94_01400, partial [Novosphingobium sp.]|nr:hypothetical protein [Novosphingobium sp.]
MARAARRRGYCGADGFELSTAVSPLSVAWLAGAGGGICPAGGAGGLASSAMPFLKLLIP